MKLLSSFPYLPLRYLFLGTLGGLAVLLCLCTYVLTKQLFLKRGTERASIEMRLDLSHLHNVLHLLLRADNLAGVSSVVTTLSARQEHELTLLTDGAGRIRAATDPALLDTPWTAHHTTLEPALVKQLTAGEPLVVAVDAKGRYLSGYIALCPGGDTRGLQPHHCGFVYTRHDLHVRHAPSVQALYTQAVQHGMGGVVVALLLWGVIHLAVTRRVEQLITTVQRFAAGKWHVRSQFQGHGELARLGQAVDSMAQTIETHQQEAAIQQQRLTALVQVAQRLTRGLTLPTVLHAITDAATQVFGGEAAFRLLEDDWLVRMGATPGALEAMAHERVALGESLSGKVALSGEPVIVADITTDSRVLLAHRLAAQPERAGALLCVPVMLEGRVLGTLHIYRERGYVFAPDTVTIATSLANQAAIAIENARLFEALQAQTASVRQTNLALEAEIQERRRAEVALREREVRLQAIIETAVEGIITIDEQGLVESYNAAAERLFGYTASEVIGRNVRLLMPSPYREAHEDYVAQYLRTGERKVIGIGREVVGLRKDNSVFPMTLAVSEMWVGERRLFTGLVNDITVRKRAEEALRQANEELEQRVQTRTAALAEANEEVKRFAYIVSHDLRAPLVNLKGFAGELRLAQQVLSTALEPVLPHLEASQATAVQRALSQDIPEALGFIDASVTRMDSLVRAILQLSRLGRRELAIEWLDTTALVQETLQTLGHQLAQRQVQVHLAPLPSVQADRTAMAQIFGNLLTNAVYYLEPGRPGTLAIRAEPRPQATAFQIQDNGRGIAQDDIPKIFEPFRRVGRQDVAGEGMGLAYVRALVRRHGGEISCQSALGTGSTFTFTIAHHLTGDTPHV